MKSQFPPKHVPLTPPPSPSPKYKAPGIPGRRPMGMSPGPAVEALSRSEPPPSLYARIRG